ncbi:hypothetical protein LTR56_020122 [Elasticomyces elasticus]|nr:hypothetical protein LTR56_020122 [Elasticomyces elasticus]KAK3633584.1 hypothetical protein LTR22_020020 [Elasticomyces elasticus]KAK4910806.1 hypothetical protein LTR49_020580 [Elasticomyces elasticus]KAK5760431.1 hypothetical protein LTS12_009475 [Elasticomyces elasticus]
MGRSKIARNTARLQNRIAANAAANAISAVVPAVPGPAAAPVPLPAPAPPGPAAVAVPPLAPAPLGPAAVAPAPTPLGSAAAAPGETSPGPAAALLFSPSPSSAAALVPPPSPGVDEPAAKRRCADSGLSRLPDSAARHSPQPTFSDFDLFQTATTTTTPAPSLDSTLQPSFNSVEPATPAKVERPKIVLKLKVYRPATIDTTQRNIDRSLPGWALGDSGLSHTAPQQQQQSALVDFTGDGNGVGEQGEFTTPHAYSPGVGILDNSLGELDVAQSHQQPTDLQRGTASPRPGFDFGESFNIPPTGEARQQTTDLERRPASQLAEKRAILDREAREYVWLKCGVRLEECHNDMFEMCSFEDHIVQCLLSKRERREGRAEIASMRRLVGAKHRGFTGACVPPVDAGYLPHKHPNSTLRWNCPEPDCPLRGEQFRYNPLRARFIAASLLPESELWKVALKTRTGGMRAVFECSARCNDYTGNQHCLNPDHLEFETARRNKDRIKHHKGDVRCICPVPCVGRNVCLDHPGRVEENAAALLSA